MRRSKTAIAGTVCGVLCALCVLAYTQSVRGEAERARADALARYGGDQIEVCVAKRDIAAGETVDLAAVETRLWVADLLPPEAVRQASEVVGSKASSTVLAGGIGGHRRARRQGCHQRAGKGRPGRRRRGLARIVCGRVRHGRLGDAGACARRGGACDERRKRADPVFGFVREGDMGDACRGSQPGRGTGRGGAEN